VTNEIVFDPGTYQSQIGAKQLANLTLKSKRGHGNGKFGTPLTIFVPQTR